MNRNVETRPIGGATALPLAALVVAVAACWGGWMGWDRHRDLDPVTGSTTGPYEPWQIIGCVLCLVVLAALAPRWLRARVVVTIVPVVFTAAWSVSAATGENVGANLWPLGAAMIFVGSVVGTVVVAAPARLLWLRRSRADE